MPGAEVRNQYLTALMITLEAELNAGLERPAAEKL
jgi:hypothetical protein